MYARGYGTEKSDVEALSWYRKAAYQGHVDAQFNMGIRYYEGKGVPQSDKEAEFWFKKRLPKATNRPLAPESNQTQTGKRI